MAAAFLLPEVLPGAGIDFKYFFIMILVLLAWFTVKWTAVTRGSCRSR